jgi:acetyl-CoA carboxylase, biotin carboxylase subunit
MKKILVANRGEIALRVMRTAREMGIRTVAIYSEADRTAPFVRYADEAVCVGPPPSAQSYLRGDEIIRIAKELGVDGIHPGYGFLSENAEFSRAVTATGITFIGPGPESISMMGSKLAAKQAASRYNIPMVPGTEEAITDVGRAKIIAAEVGYPILIKASAGGGGKGMRIVEHEGEFEEQMQRAVSEAQSAFGDSSVFIEKYIGSPRHVEIQVLADTHGNIRYLFERECSVQRRHQKVVEEAPSAILTPEVREAMGRCAVDVARSCDYVGAGTVEFLVDEHLHFYFLEMNTRLQVEHPVTEMITGVDLVREQIEIARGKAIPFSQEDLTINGHSIEIRVYAEDPMNNFLPDIGRIGIYEVPKGPGIRVDDGFEPGQDIPIYYDPMIAKLVVHAATRDMAIDKMIRAIDDYKISGVKTTLSFCRFALDHHAFRSGNFDTHFVKNYYKPEYLQRHEEDELAVAAAVAAFLAEEEQATATTAGRSEATSKWKQNRT